jgi:GntR family transcriptional regulator
LLQGRGTPNLHAARAQINAVTASIEVARALGIQRGDALLSFKSDLFLNNGRIIDHSFAYFLPGYFRFHVVRKLEI